MMKPLWATLRSRHANDRNPIDEIRAGDIIAFVGLKYAETGDQYVEVLQKIIEQNDLKDFDDAKLLPSSVELESLI